MAKPGALVKRSRGAVLPPPLTVTQLLLDVSLVRLLLAVLGLAFRPVQVSSPPLLVCWPALLALCFLQAFFCVFVLHFCSLCRHRLWEQGLPAPCRSRCLQGGDMGATSYPLDQVPTPPPLGRRWRRYRRAGAPGAGAWQCRYGDACCVQLDSWPRRRAHGRCASWAVACSKCGAGTWRQVRGRRLRPGHGLGRLCAVLVAALGKPALRVL